MAKTVNADQADAYQKTAEEVVAELGSDQRRGLSGQEAGARLQRYGPNELETETPVSRMAAVVIVAVWLLCLALAVFLAVRIFG